MSKLIKADGYTFEVMLTEDQIHGAVSRLGAELTRDYRDRRPVFLGVLNGSFLFIADLVREFDADCQIDFLKIGSYGQGMQSSGAVRLDKDLSMSIEGRHVIVVEDIIDSGISVTFIRQHIQKSKPASIRFATLLLKKEKARVDFPIDYVGFEIGNEFVIGYGLDYAQQFRHLKDIYVTKDA